MHENDTGATEEIRFGDNDNLSATVVNLIGADLLVILTDVDGLYESPPTPGAPPPRLVETVERITPELESAAQGSVRVFGRGGMTTKLEAARTASRCGAATVLCNGRTRGELVIDEGAARALVERGRSLLPAGIREVRGKFGIGDPVACVGPAGESVARGLVAYASQDIERIAGMATRDIPQVLGYSNGDEVIHRNDLVLVGDRGGATDPAEDEQSAPRSGER